MSYSLNYGHEVGVIPARVIKNYIKTSSITEIKVLLLLCCNESILSNLDNSVDDICNIIDASKDDVTNAISFWKSEKIIVSDKSKKTIHITANDKSKTPNYSGKEIAQIVDSNELRSLIDMCSSILGIIFNPTDVNTIVTLYHHLGVSPEYILTLCSYCSQIGKKSLAYIQKTAYNLYDDGIDDIEKLEEYLKHKTEIDSYNSKIQKVLGISGRALTTKENNSFEKWCGWGFGEDIITLAYEITIEKTGKYTITYLDKILTNWNESGYKSLLEIKTAQDEYEKNKELSKGSFDTNEFFELALKRSRDNTVKD